MNDDWYVKIASDSVLRVFEISGSSSRKVQPDTFLCKSARSRESYTFRSACN